MVKTISDKILAENFPNLKKETNIQVREAQRTPTKMNSKRTTHRHIILKWQKLNIESSKGSKRGEKKGRVKYKGTMPPPIIQIFFLQKLCRTEGSGMIY